MEKCCSRCSGFTEIFRRVKKIDSRTDSRLLCVALLVELSILFKSLPRTLVDSWIYAEEIHVYMIVADMLHSGQSSSSGFVPNLEQHIVIYISKLLNMNVDAVCYYINPVIISLAIIFVFAFVKNITNKTDALIISTLFAFSESIFYRSAHFGSTEALGILFMFATLYAYSNHWYALTAALTAIIPFAHLLPFLFTVAVIVLHRMMIGHKKEKLVALSIGLLAILYVLSPFNTHVRLHNVLNFASLFSSIKISNLQLYSITDLLHGIKIFAGTFCLILCFIFYLYKLYKKETILQENDYVFVSMLLVSVSLICWSWIAYNKHIFAPPRLTAYLTIPLSYFFTKSINRKTLKTFATCVLAVVMLFASFSSLNDMLYINHAITTDEVYAIQTLADAGHIKNLSEWWSDYTANTMLLFYENNTFYWNEELNETKAANNTNALVNFITKDSTRFNYVFLSERIKNDAFFIVMNGTRSTHIETHIKDRWNSSDEWIQIYNNDTVVVYKRRGY